MPQVNEIPFSSERKMMTTIHQRDGHFVAFTKGAPGVVLDHCSSCWNGGELRRCKTRTASPSAKPSGNCRAKGCMCWRWHAKRSLRAEATDEVEQGMTFLGLQALMDPPRAEAAEAIARAQGAGIRVVMITGDNGLTAQAIARQLGIGDRVVEARAVGRSLAPGAV